MVRDGLSDGGHEPGVSRNHSGAVVIELTKDTQSAEWHGGDHLGGLPRVHRKAAVGSQIQARREGGTTVCQWVIEAFKDEVTACIRYHCAQEGSSHPLHQSFLGFLNKMTGCFLCHQALCLGAIREAIVN